MSDATCTIRLELALDGDSPTGSAICGAGRPRAFVGWLGLVSAVEVLLRADHAPGVGEGAPSEDPPGGER